MGRRYYCDYCDKAFIDDLEARKKHLNSSLHQKLRKEHYLTCRVFKQFCEFNIRSTFQIVEEILNMDVPRATLDILKYGVCGAQLSRGPVYTQHFGAALCGSCKTPETKATRNLQYEALAQFHAFPCKYKDLGCEETVPFVQGDEVIPHEEMCEHRQWPCPVLGCARCDWLGTRGQLLQHCEDQHQELVLHSPCTLPHDLTTPSTKTYLLCALQVLFLLHVKVNVAAKKLYHSVRYFGPTDEADSFTYILELKRRKATLIQEGTSLMLDIDSLLSVLGGIDGVRSTVEVQRREREVGAEMQQQVCAGCDTQVAALVYRDQRGWVCERCAPARRPCKFENWGCRYQDVDSKCEKHEAFFCEKRGGRCGICNKVVKRGSFPTHYDSACREVCRFCSTWGPTEGNNKRCLMSGAASMAVCQYRLDDAVFDLEVFIPVSSERLREYRCVVRVTQPATGQVRTYTPDTKYDEMHDWRIEVERGEFPRWTGVFSVSLNITKI